MSSELKGLSMTGRLRIYFVSERDLGSQLDSLFVDCTRKAVAVVVEHESFDEVIEGEQIPVFGTVDTRHEIVRVFNWENILTEELIGELLVRRGKVGPIVVDESGKLLL